MAAVVGGDKPYVSYVWVNGGVLVVEPVLRREVLYLQYELNKANKHTE